MPNLKKAGYQGTTLTTEQKSAAAAAFESCINNSDFVLPSQCISALQRGHYKMYILFIILIIRMY